jgi:hypothetical protein
VLTRLVVLAVSSLTVAHAPTIHLARKALHALNKPAIDKDVSLFRAQSHRLVRTRIDAPQLAQIPRVDLIALKPTALPARNTPSVILQAYAQLRIVRDRDVKHRPVLHPQIVSIPISALKLVSTQAVVLIVLSLTALHVQCTQVASKLRLVLSRPAIVKVARQFRALHHQLA